MVVGADTGAGGNICPPLQSGQAGCILLLTFSSTLSQPNQILTWVETQPSQVRECKQLLAEFSPTFQFAPPARPSLLVCGVAGKTVQGQNN